jgi:hypothetical protein
MQTRIQVDLTLGEVVKALIEGLPILALVAGVSFLVANGNVQVCGVELSNNTSPADPSQRRQNGVGVQVKMCVAGDPKQDCCKDLPPPAVTPGGP